MRTCASLSSTRCASSWRRRGRNGFGPVNAVQPWRYQVGSLARFGAPRPDRLGPWQTRSISGSCGAAPRLGTRGRESYPEIVPDLQRADLIRANLSEANLSGADLSDANLSDANLEADLTAANLISANLTDANLTDANLTDANLTDAKVVSTPWFKAPTMDGCTIGRTVFGDVDLRPFFSAGRFLLPCIVDWSSVARSIRHPELLDFLVKAGVPEAVAIYLIDSCRTIDPKDMFSMLQSTFISYGGPDEEFAKQLRENLQRNGVKTWLYCEDSVPGTRIHRETRAGIREYDRVILICSENSLSRPGVLAEIKHTLGREEKAGGAELLIPVAVDRFVYDWAPERAPEIAEAIQERGIADFTNPNRFSDSLAKLLTALEKRPETVPE